VANQAGSGVRQFYLPGGPRQEIQAQVGAQTHVGESRSGTTVEAGPIPEPTAANGVYVIVSLNSDGIVCQPCRFAGNIDGYQR